jgi:hypothetical protein
MRMENRRKYKMFRNIEKKREKEEKEETSLVWFECVR